MMEIGLIQKATDLSEEDINRVITVWLELALLNIVFYGSYKTIFGTIKMGKDGSLYIADQNPAIVDIVSNNYDKQDIIDIITNLVVKFDS